MDKKPLYAVILVLFALVLALTATTVTASLEVAVLRDSAALSPSIDDCPGLLPIGGPRPEWELYDKVISGAGRLRCIYDQIQYRATLTPSHTPIFSPTPTERWIPPGVSRDSQGASREPTLPPPSF